MLRLLISMLVASVCCGNSLLDAQSTVNLARVSVVQDGSCQGVQSAIKRKQDGSEGKRIRDTDEKGILTLNPPVGIDSGHMIYAAPFAETSYFDSFEQQVEPQMKFGVVPRTRDESTKVVLVKQIELGGMAREVAQRLGENSSAEPCASVMAQAHEHVAYLAAGELLEVSDPVEYDVVQKRVVASQALKNAMLDYQIKNNLKQTGMLDLSTVDSLSDGQYGEIKWEQLYGVSIIPEPGGPPTFPNDYFALLHGLGNRQIRTLMTNAEDAEQRHEFGVAAMLYTELAHRFRHVGFEEAQNWSAAAEVESYRLIGQALALDDAFAYDPLQGRYVMTWDLSARLKEYQNEHGLRVTGRADYATLKSLGGGTDLGAYVGGTR